MIMSATNEEKEENEDDKRFTRRWVDVLPLRDLVFEPTCPRERS